MLERLQIIYGDMSPNVARLFARLPLPDPDGDSDPDGDWRLTGSIRGPESEYAATLPTTFTLRDLGPGKSLLAAVTIADPCFWSPHYPMLYEVRVDLFRGRELAATKTWSLGLRRLGASGRDLILESRRWVLRAAQRSMSATTDLQDWRETDTAMFVAMPDAALLEQASRRGQLLVVALEGTPKSMADDLRMLAQWAAVALVVLPRGAPADIRWADLAPNLLLAQRFACGADIKPAPWCQVALCDVKDPAEFAERTGHLTLPVVAVRQHAAPAPVPELRQGCDHLQRDLAPIGQFAGYIV